MSKRYVLYTRGRISVDTTPAPIVPAGTVYIRAGKVTLLNGSNIVAFSTPLASSNWVVINAYMILQSNGSFYPLIDLVTTPTTLGFSIIAPEAGDMTYIMMLPS